MLMRDKALYCTLAVVRLGPEPSQGLAAARSLAIGIRIASTTVPSRWLKTAHWNLTRPDRQCSVSCPTAKACSEDRVQEAMLVC